MVQQKLSIRQNAHITIQGALQVHKLLFYAMGAITGAIAGAYYNRMPCDLYKFGTEKLPDDIKKIILDFDNTYRREVSYRWKDAEHDAEALIIKVRSGEILY